jgi:23S rRNA (uracil1939-C5)-methyltransferase
VRPAVGSVHTAQVQSFGEGAEVRVLVQDFPVFVEGALPGEYIRVRITHLGERYGHGEVLDLADPSPDRVRARCRHYGVCGGCDLQHMAWERQAELKTRLVARLLGKALGVEPEALPVFDTLAPEQPWGHRGKIGMRLAADEGGVRVGLLARRSNDVVDLRECPVQDEAGNALAGRLIDAVHRLRVPAGEPKGPPGLRALLVRVAPGTGELGVVLVGNAMRLDALSPLIQAARDAGAVQVAYNFHPDPGPQLIGRRTTLVWGKPRLQAQVAGVHYLISPGAFFQTSAWGATALVETVRQATPPGGDVLDLYCGGGLLTLGLVGHARRLVGIEENTTAVDDANKALKLNGFSDVSFVAGRVEEKLAGVLEDRRFSAVVLDPPKAGAEVAVLDAVARHRPGRIVYVACDPYGLARDAALLAERGYRFEGAQPIDMFPQTAEVETVAIFEPQRR